MRAYQRVELLPGGWKLNQPASARRVMGHQVVLPTYFGNPAGIPLREGWRWSRVMSHYLEKPMTHDR